MKRRDLIKKLKAQAKSEGKALVEVEGARHTKVSIGDKHSVVPRHKEINEITAQAILNQMGVDK